ncbi:sporulation integral membrane protein YtvI [Clostridium sp. JN-9]|uniref:sporulation integral membrane protein YtvI n=1 Tax=Clostridium sp. JN-9 TaxID=2507159 RepID=UPI000FFE04AD|nr:sporulation integral membrane protein YtvI [Clostridium sp. JN-9]QAT41549.1 sporulation integral membrane protein YtvI [Clostridium sp. JN-9]
MEDLIKKLDKIVIFFIIYSLIFFIFFGTLSYTLPFVLALLFAFFLRIPTEYLIKKFKMKNSLASLISTLVFFAILISALSFGIVAITQEVTQLGKSTQNYLSKNSNQIYNFVENLKKYYSNLDPAISNTLEKNFTGAISKISNMTVTLTGKIISFVINFLSYVPYIIMVILFTLLSTYFFTKDMTSAKEKFRSLIPNDKSDKLIYIFNEAKRMLGNYLLSYMLIISITFIETLIVFLIFRVKYAVILSIICAIADILPVLGIGTIYIPLSIFYFFIVKNYFTAFGILISYILVSIIRQIIEPKIVSSSLGIHPVAVLAALFIGLKASGISGMFFCIFLVVFFNILKSVKIL